MVLPFLGYCFNEPTKVAQLLKKSPNLVALSLPNRGGDKKFHEIDPWGDYQANLTHHF
jgi:hypothetical protein